MNTQPMSTTRIRRKLHFRKRLIFIPPNESGSLGRHRFDIGASDQEVEHDCHFGEECRLQPTKSGAVVTGEELRRNAERDPGEAGDDQPNAQDARQESRPIDKQSEWKKPHAPENLADEFSLIV